MKARRRSGFTLIELLLVMAILAILATIVVVKTTGTTKDAKVKATKTSIATRWLLGGGNRKRALTWVREAAAAPNADFYVHTEAEFALWEMLVREKNIPDAVVVARRLAKDFPENKELIAFLKTNG